MLKQLIKIRIALLHAKYHRCIRKAEAAMAKSDIKQFRKYIYRAEDAWRKIVILTNKTKTNG
jgi:flagellin-specific chaperone FliS